MNEYTSKILIVDDNEPFLLLTGKLLKEPGRTIITAVSGIAALDILDKEDDISLILIDIQMPGMDGFETVKRIKENEKLKDIPVIFITGFYKLNEYVNQGYEIGAYDYIQKPFDAHELKNKVNVFLTIHHQRVQLKVQAEQLKILLRNISEGVLRITQNGEVSFANKSALEIVELTEEKVVGHQLSDILKSFDANDFPLYIKLKELLSINNSSAKQQLTILTNDGNKKIISFDATEIKDSNGTADGSVIVFQEISN